MNEQTPTVNGITFFTFCQHLRGYNIYNQKGNEVPKFILFWNGTPIKNIFERFDVKARL